MSGVLYFILFIVGIIVVLQLMVRLRGIRYRGKPAPKVGGRLGQKIQRREKVVAYFFSPSCSACRTMEKLLPRVQEKFKNIIHINVMRDRETAQQFGVMGTPTTVVIVDGKIAAYFVGVTAPAKILKSLGIN